MNSSRIVLPLLIAVLNKTYFIHSILMIVYCDLGNHSCIHY